jgi:hypothetical protein
LLLAALPVPLGAHAQAVPKVTVKSQFTVDRYGFAIINETVRFSNNQSSAVQPQSLTFGFGSNLSSKIVATKVIGAGFTASSLGGGSYTVSGSPTIPVKGNASYVFSLLVNGIVSRAKNGSLEVFTLSTPAISPKVDSLLDVVTMPASTALRSAPAGLTASITGSNDTYYSSAKQAAPAAVVTSVRAVSSTSTQDFNPLRIYDTTRTITAAPDGTPLVTDEIEFQNMGTTTMSLIYVNLLAPAGARVTIMTPTEPRLLYPVTITVASNAIDLALFAVGYPSEGVVGGSNFTLQYQYPLGSAYYTISGGKVSVNIPESLPIRAFADAYTIGISLPQGATASQSTPVALTSVTPWQGGTAQFSYGLSVGWAIESGLPGASLVFVLLLIGLFAARTTTAEAEVEGEEESSTELASDMIKVFDEKTNLINSLWPEISAKDPNEMDKEYFDELRGRLDSFRSRALQRLNEVKQKSTSQKFFEVVNQIQATEREVDRAAKDKLNLYQQYYLRQMRKEVYDRLLPQYTKRLEKALNQLSDELHTVQREAKLL